MLRLTRKPVENGDVYLVNAGRKQRDRRQNENQRTQNHRADRFHDDQILINRTLNGHLRQGHISDFGRIGTCSRLLWCYGVSFGKPASTPDRVRGRVPLAAYFCRPTPLRFVARESQPTSLVRINNLPNTKPRAGCRTGLGEKWRPVQYRP